MTPTPSPQALAAVEAVPAPLVVTMPAPPQELSPNRSRNGHWSKKSNATKLYREACRICTRAAMTCEGFPKVGKVRVSYEWQKGTARGLPYYRPQDEQNAVASLKAMNDGMVDAGLVTDDKAAHWSFGGITLTKGQDVVIVTVEVLA